MNVLIILHGWQSSKEKWQEVKKNLESDELKVVVPDIPGFKPKTQLKKPWTLNDYVEWFKSFSQKEEKFFLLGHSFGGRISIKFAQKYPGKLKGLILVSAAGIKRNSLRKRFLEKGAKMMKTLKIEDMPFWNGCWQFVRKFFYRFVLRKTDYLEVPGALKETIKNILTEDLTPLLDKISLPTLILWGGKDKITPIEDAHLMKKKIKNSRLEILEETGHIPHLENPQLLSEKVKEYVLHS